MSAAEGEKEAEKVNQHPENCVENLEKVEDEHENANKPEEESANHDQGTVNQSTVSFSSDHSEDDRDEHQTIVDFKDGYINFKKMESMINTISPCITYTFRCDTDVTNLLSGTSMKAVISYLTDYIAKPTLKTHQIFATACNVFDRNKRLDADEKHEQMIHEN